MTKQELLEFIEDTIHDDDEILFVTDDGSGYTMELNDTPTLTRPKQRAGRHDRTTEYWDKEYGKKFTVVFGGLF